MKKMYVCLRSIHGFFSSGGLWEKKKQEIEELYFWFIKNKKNKPLFFLLTDPCKAWRCGRKKASSSYLLPEFTDHPTVQKERFFIFSFRGQKLTSSAPPSVSIDAR